tara:strand:+ start:1162 stop:1857 length:696 start_codon:yes stop_codon:yes gene_type:complete
MLALKLGKSLTSSRNAPWLPSDESSLEGWFRKATNIQISGAPPSISVSGWQDMSNNGHNMVQLTESEMPTFPLERTGDVIFDASATQSLESASVISLSGQFTIGIILQPLGVGVSVLGSNTLGGEFVKVQSSTVLRVKIDGSQVDLSVDSGTLVEQSYLVVTRNASNLITLHKNGVAQADTETLAGTADIDTIGVRKTDLNPFDGNIREVQFYSSTSAALTANVNDRLAAL